MQSQHWNVAKYAFTKGRAGINFTLTPWLINLVPDIFHFYTSAYYKWGEQNTISSSVRYFTLGEIHFSGIPAGSRFSTFHPREYAIDAGYSRKFNEHLSGGIVVRYINSSLAPSSTSSSGDRSQPGITVTGDLGFYYQNDLSPAGRTGEWALGFLISNLGPPVSYTDRVRSDPMPTNLRAGGRVTMDMGTKAKLSLLTDLNKLMVPTPPVVSVDTTTGEPRVIRGKPYTDSWLWGMMRSFWDAPGVQKGDGTYSVSAEELNEISWSLGTEFIFEDWLALRAGYFHEHASKGNRKNLTFGIGVNLEVLRIDVSYLYPANGQNSPLSNTFRFTLGLEL